MSDNTFAFGQFLLLPAQRALLDNGRPVRLGSRGFDILIALVERAGEVVSKEELIARVWPHTVVDEGGLRVHIAGLRKVLGEVRSGMRYIGNVPSRGYCFIAPVSRAEREALPVDLPVAPASTQLPSLLTRLIGRDDTVATLVDVLPKRRFATLVGPGGIGKTTVALAAAAQLEHGFGHGVYFVDFSALTDPTLVNTTVNAALGIPARSDSPLQDLISWLSDRSVLLILDNCEHVIENVASLTETVLGKTLGSHILATSREPLRAHGEWVLRLPSLGAPPTGTTPSYAQALDFPAFELFVERAAASFDGTAFNDADVTPLSHLCRKLDGIPLAIELVAAQIGFYGLGGLISMLEERLTLTMLGRRTALPRHQTLRNTLDWSYELLSSDEQSLLRQLSVFSDRFALRSAAAIAGEPAPDTAQILMSLVSKSLVSADPGDDEVAYKLLETTRSYAAEKLQATDEHQDVLRRHANHCLAAVQLATAEFEGRVPDRWRRLHGRRIDDVRAALRWTLSDRGDPELGGQLAADAAALYFGLWLVPEYIQVLERALDRLPPEAADGRLDMQLSLEFGQACLAMRGGAIEGLNALGKSASIAARLGEPGHQLSALWGSFSCHLLRGDYGAAMAATEEFGRVVQESRDTRSNYAFHRMMALCLHFTGDQPTALTHARASLLPASMTIGQLHGNTYQLDHRTASLTQLARILWLQGHGHQAMAAVSQAVDAAHAADHALSLTYTLTYAACPLSLWAGNDELARRYIDDLQTCANEHSLVFWQSWPRLYREALSRRKSDVLAAKTATLPPMHVSQIDMMATVHASFVSAEAIARARAGVSAWCAPEVLRVVAETEWRSSPLVETANGAHLLQEAMAMAASQGAHAWSLRCAISFAQFHPARRHAESRRLLTEALQNIPEQEDNADVRTAQRLLASLSEQRTVRV